MFNFFLCFVNTSYICKKFFSVLQIKIYNYERLHFKKLLEALTEYDVFLRLHFDCLIRVYYSLLYHPNFSLIMKLKVWNVVRVVQRSSNGKAVIDIDTMSRKVSVTPVYASSFFKPYLGTGCCTSQCLFPKMTCKYCRLNTKVYEKE